MADSDVTLRVSLNVDDVQSQADQLRKKIETIFDKTNGKKMPASFVRMKQSMRDLYAESKQLSKTIESLKGTDVPTKPYEQLTKELEKSDQKAKQLAERIQYLQQHGSITGVDKAEYNRLMSQFTKEQRTNAYLARQKLDMQTSGRAFVKWETTEEYQKMIAHQSKLNDRIQIATLKAQEFLDRIHRVRDALQKVGTVIKGIVHAFQSVVSAIRRVGASLISIYQKAKQVANVFKDWYKRMRGIDTGMGDTKKSMKQLFKFALKYILGLRSIFLLYKKLRTAGVEAYKGLASQFPELQAEIDALKNSFFQLKNSIATMAQPIVSALVPALKTLMSWLSAVMTALANFFAILTGAKYIYKASKVNKEWAKSAGGAGKAAKEASEDIAEYDNLILIQQDKDGGGGGGAGDVDEYAGAWEKVEAESDFAQKLKDAINAGDWEGVGTLIAQKLNGVVLRLDNWVNYKFRPFGKKWANQIARILNGLTEAFDSGKLGKTVADSLNALADIVNEFFTTYNFLTLGSKVGKAITSFFKNLDAQLISTAMANRLNAMITFVKGLLTDLDFEGIGNKIGTGIQNFVNTVNWRQLGENMYNLGKGLINAIITAFKDGNLINTFANAVKEFLTGARIKEVLSNMADLAKTVVNGLANAMTNHQIGKKAGEALNNLFKNIKVKEVMTGLVNLANSIITELSNFLLTVDWHVIANAIVDLFNKINFEDVLSTLMTVAINIVDALATAILKIDWGKIGDAIANLIASIDWMQLLGTLVKAALGLVKALGQALLSLVTNPEALLSIAEGLAVIFGAKFIWSKISGVIGGGLASAVSTGFASAGGSAGLATALKNSLSGILGKSLAVIGTAELGGRFGAWLGKTLFAGSDEKLQEAYEEFGKAPIINTIKAIGTELGALFEKSTLTGNTTLGTALTDWFSGGAYLDDKLNAWLEENNKIVDANYQKYLDMLERRVKEGKIIRETDMELLKKYRDFDAQVNESLVTNSNHYADIAKQNAGVVTQAEKAMADEAIANSNHYVEIAKANAQEHKNVFAEMLSNINSVMDESNKHMDEVKQSAIESSNHYAEIAKQQSGYYKKIADEAVKSSNHYVEIAKQNMKTEQDEADATATHVKEAVADIPEVYESTFSSAVAKMESAFDGTQTYFDGVAEGVKQPFSTMAEYFGDTFGDAWGRAVDVFETDTPAFQKIEASIGNVFKSSINNMIDGVNTTMTGPFSKLSAALNQMRGFTVGGARIFASLPSFSVPKIPRLAQGAVLPPNQPFIAQVGEQTHGTNVEAPLETIAEALRQVLSENSGSNNQPIVLQLNGNQIARAVWDEENKRYKQTGSRFSYS